MIRKNPNDPVLNQFGKHKISLGLPLVLLAILLLIIFISLKLLDSGGQAALFMLISPVFNILGILLLASIFLSNIYLFFKGLYMWIKPSNEPKIREMGRSKFLMSIYNKVILLLPLILGYVSFSMLRASSPGPTSNSLNISGSVGSISPLIGGSPYKTPLYSVAPQNYGTGGMAADSIGFSVGGSKDVNNFRENIKNGYLPLPTDLTYEGLFYDYFFDTGIQEQCQKLFCPSYTSAISKDPYSGQDDYFLSVGLNSGIKESDFQRKKLNIILVLDISGSMSSPFNRYYYDQSNNSNGIIEENENEDYSKTKMKVASESAVALIDHLEPDDSFGMVLFDDVAYLENPLNKISKTDVSALKKRILELEPQGGTNMSAGMKEASSLLNENIYANSNEFENRIIFLTDAQPNQGDLTTEGMLGITEKNAESRIYTTFIGIGVDFNTDLIEKITKIRGSNYYAVHSPADFKKRMDEGFDYMVTPLVFNLNLRVDSPGFEIKGVYGSPEADMATGEIMKVNTLFPSERVEEETKGGLVLLHLRKISNDNRITLTTSYEDRSGKKDSSVSAMIFEEQPEYYSNNGIRKGIVLSRYANLLKNWLMYERELAGAKNTTGVNNVMPTSESYYSEGIPVFPITYPELSEWERQSVKLKVSDEYKIIFPVFLKYFESEMKAIGDDTLEKELLILKKLSN